MTALALLIAAVAVVVYLLFFAEREKTITEAIQAAETQEEREAVEALVNTFDSESDAHENAKTALRGEISAMEAELSSIEAQAPAAAARPAAENKNERMMTMTPMTTGVMSGLSSIRTLPKNALGI